MTNSIRKLLNFKIQLETANDVKMYKIFKSRQIGYLIEILNSCCALHRNLDSSSFGWKKPMSKISFMFGTLQNKQFHSLLNCFYWAGKIAQISLSPPLISKWPLTRTSILFKSLFFLFFFSTAASKGKTKVGFHLGTRFNVVLQHWHSRYREQGFGNLERQRPEPCACRTGIGIICTSATAAATNK